jgi:hypothetical protein
MGHVRVRQNRELYLFMLLVKEEVGGRGEIHEPLTVTTRQGRPARGQAAQERGSACSQRVRDSTQGGSL